MFNPAQFIQQNPFIGIMIFTFLIALILTLISKYTTNQKRMKEIKEKQKECQKRAKECGSDTAKMLEINKEMMSYSGELMKHSLVPMMITLIPMFILFGWANSHIAYNPIHPGQIFTLTATMIAAGDSIGIEVPEGMTLLDNSTQDVPGSKKVSWSMKGPEGKYDLILSYQNKSVSREVIISDSDYAPVSEAPKESIGIKSTSINNIPLIFIPFLGLGWIWSYIIFTFAFNLLLRKILNVQ